jgi:hypothetical protein
MELKPTMTTLSATSDGVLAQVIDGPSGRVFQLFLSWKELEVYVREHGKDMTFGDFQKGGSKGFRDMMEMDPEG